MRECDCEQRGEVRSGQGEGEGAGEEGEEGEGGEGELFGGGVYEMM